MRLLSLAGLFALPLVFAAASNVQDELTALAAANGGLIKLNAQTFELLTTPKRTWSATIQFTALDPRRRCAPCKEFQPSFSAVAKAWTTVPKVHRDTHYFAVVDFDEAPNVFQKLGLATAPVVYVYPATEGPHSTGKSAYSKYDFSNGFDPEPLAEQLSKHTVVPIPYRAPIDWAHWITLGFFGIAFLVALRFIGPIITNRWVWCGFTVITTIVMISGFMFNRIRDVPYNGANGAFIAPGFQSQYGQETQVVSLIYGALALSFVMLTTIIPRQTGSEAKQRTQIYLWTAIIMVIYSLLVSIFKIKNRGYPFKLFL